MSDVDPANTVPAPAQSPAEAGGAPAFHTPRPGSGPVPTAAPDAAHPARQRAPGQFRPRLRHRARLGRVFAVTCLLATLVGVVVLAVLLVDILRDGASRLNGRFLTGIPSRLTERAGVAPALAGSAWILALTALVGFPLGVGTALWLEEYAPDNRFRRFVETNISNLAGVPSIVYGILGLAVFVRALSLGRSVLSAALTLTLLVLPVIIIGAQEAIKAVPNSIRLGAYALGATRWEAIRHQVLPLALPGILTGTILAVSRAVGEAAPVIMVGALGFIAFVPNSPGDAYTVIPFQIYSWVSRPQAEWKELAAAASLVLLALLLTMNAAAIYLRNRFSRRY